jgi:FdhE protein
MSRFRMSQPEARQACHRLAQWEPEARLALAGDVVQDTVWPEMLGEALYAAAAVQVYLAGMAMSLDARALKPQADTTCPCCGGAPAASLVAGWTQASKARYLCCSLCGTLWNYVRMKCVTCASTDGISYYAIGRCDKHVAVEACTACRTYLKHLHQHENPLPEPFADDVASYGLDLPVRNKAFRKSGVNPWFIGG